MSDDLLVMTWEPGTAPDLAPSGYDRLVLARGEVYDIRHFDHVGTGDAGSMAVGAELEGGFVHVLYGLNGADHYYSPAQVQVLVLATETLELPRDRERYAASIAALEARRAELLAQLEAARQQEDLDAQDAAWEREEF